MPVKGTKALEAVKSTTVITTYVTGAPVAPAAGHLSVYVDLAAADQHRLLEVGERLRNLIDRAREIGYNGLTAVTLYLRMPLDGAKDSIVVTTTSTTIVEGQVAIGISAEVRSADPRSILIDACFKEIIDWMAEQDRLTV